MGAIKHASGVKLLLKIGDGESPEVFSAPCSINAERGINFVGEENTTTIPDCADLEAIQWVVSEITSLRVTANGAGVLNTPDVDTYFDWWKSGESRNCKLILDVPSADGGIIFSGAFKLPNFELTGNKGEKVNVSMSLASDGEVTSAANT